MRFRSLRDGSRSHDMVAGGTGRVRVGNESVTQGGTLRKRLACRSAPAAGVERCTGCGDGVQGGFGVDREAVQALVCRPAAQTGTSGQRPTTLVGKVTPHP